MPLYEFNCQKCGENFSVRTSISEREQVQCPRCNSGDLKQKLHGNFMLPGNQGCQTPPGIGFT